MNELPIAPAARRDPRSMEMIRVQLAEKKCHCVLRIGFWEDRADEPAAWGILLADMIRHIADAHADQFGRDRAAIIARVRAAFEAEMDTPTSGNMGEFLIANDS